MSTHKRKTFIFSIFLMWASALYAEPLNVNFDGEKWRLLGRYIEAKRMRITLLQGICQGAAVMNGKKTVEVFDFGVDSDTLIAAIDQFYKTEENARIPLVYALYIIGMQTRGASKEAVDAELKKIRTGSRFEFLKSSDTLKQ